MGVNEVKQALDNLVSNAKLIRVSEQAGAMSRAIIDQRTRRGEFLGGQFANKGYSTSPMPFSDVTRQIAASEDDTFWITKNGRPRKYLKGGYKKFRELTGRRTDAVTLQFSGEMLNSLNPSVDAVSDSQIQVIVTVPAGQMVKAFQTNEQREWLALSDEEVDRVFKMFESGFVEG